MTRLHVDPNTLQCPDFTGEDQLGAREALIAAGIPEDRAADALKAVWTRQNEKDKVTWQQQIAADHADQAERRQAALDAEEARRVAEAVDKEEIMKEDKKKNREKYIPVMVGVAGPDIEPNIVSPAVMKSLRKGNYVHLWHFTNSAVLEARRNPDIFNEDTVEMVKAADSSFVLAPTTSIKTSHSVVDDKDLEWDDFRTATMRMLKALKDAGWPEDRVHMFAGFWGNLERHELRLSTDKRNLQALLLYQDERRLMWHNNLLAGKGAFDLSILSEPLITKCVDRVYREDRDRKDRAYDLEVSTFRLLHGLHIEC
ncbi:hypothetical protein BKA70DRAFT_1440483 [Coprinopsis sp. MPI-PUGE-AT-0042]|nr:hypothetical protein BKA70DRAFT_1440483 [Coprinopsis sp. MPI-PUGE-AT-0042]